MARPTKLNPERIQRICDALRSGNTRQASAQYAGVNYHSLRRWERSNDDFADAIKKAEADHVVYCVATIKGSAHETENIVRLGHFSIS